VGARTRVGRRDDDPRRRRDEYADPNADFGVEINTVDVSLDGFTVDFTDTPSGDDDSPDTESQPDEPDPTDTNWNDT